jgi:ABC-type transporter Mla MlaB component
VADADTTLRLPAQVDAASAARIYREWTTRVAQLQQIDFSQVQQIDSPGVALVLALRARRGSDLTLHAVPARFVQLCRAHRVTALGVA